MPKDEYDKNMNDYKLLCETNNLNYKNIVKASQAHTDNIMNINSVEESKIIDTNVKTDGLITNKKQIILAYFGKKQYLCKRNFIGLWQRF